MRKLISLFLICLFVMPLVLADGMIIRPRDYIVEKGQLAYIDYNKDAKLEKMLLGIQLGNMHGQKAAWIFPVPSNPNDVAIDVLPNLPNYYGSEVKSYARNLISNIVEKMVMYQIWPAFFFFNRIVYSMNAPSVGRAMESTSVETGQSVVVYEHIEKYGLTTELVGAKDGAAIRLYLVNKGLEVPFEANTVLRNYADKDFTFVVSWLNEPQYDIQKGMAEPSYYPNYRQVGVQVMFKTGKAYYPLLPTSVYGSEKVPATIFVNGYVEPVVPEGIKSFTKTTYMKTSGGYYPMYDDSFSSGATPKEYTVISINDVPSKFFTEDMWFTEGAPSEVNYATSIVNSFDYDSQQGIKVWFMVLALSLLLGSLLGLIIFREQWWKLALVSLANGLSIIGLIIALFFVKTKGVDSNLKQKIKQAGLVTISRDFTRKFIFLLSFSILFVVLAYVLGAILKAPLS